MHYSKLLLRLSNVIKNENRQYNKYRSISYVRNIYMITDGMLDKYKNDSVFQNAY
jgi:hypothetical protein